MHIVIMCHENVKGGTSTFPHVCFLLESIVINKNTTYIIGIHASEFTYVYSIFGPRKPERFPW